MSKARWEIIDWDGEPAPFHEDEEYLGSFDEFDVRGIDEDGGCLLVWQEHTRPDELVADTTHNATRFYRDETGVQLGPAAVEFNLTPRIVVGIQTVLANTETSYAEGGG
jgi:hypothetical protein